MFTVTPLRPAYGRKYRNQQQVKDDFDANKDFITPTDQYINKPQLLELNLAHVEIRYGNNNEKCTVIKVAP